ncbi:glycosyltransferase [Kallotenue papyrolyticum]|uniref:glycosyltransferase n=1 Tax=Kallotenue papyrolyticum TaxID=1325125 RepID=UPI000478565E|nr:glycosyltransferase [Kallotenue papyrolyticum]
MSLPSVSVVVVNFNGRQHLEACFTSLLRQNYPADRLELILVDNASQDDSLAVMAERFPSVRVLANQRNLGFAPAVNQGAAAARGQYLALLNNDAYADPNWLRCMVEALQRHRPRGVACVGATMLDWHGQRIDFIGGGVNFYGHGDQFYHQLPAEAVTPREQEILFACGGAMLVDRQVFLEVGGFDPDYFAYFEDVDFGWRLWLFGHRVLFVPEAVVYHRQHGTSSTMYAHQVRTLLERNALLTIIKNYDDEHLQRVLPAALLLLLQRSLLDAGDALQRADFDVRQRDRRTDASTTVVPTLALSYLVAAGDVLQQFPEIWRKRAQIQARRQRADAEILPLLQRPMGTNYLSPVYQLTQEVLTEAFGIRGMFQGMRTTRVLIISSDPLYENLAGPGIRAVEMARHLAPTCWVTLAAPEQARVTIPEVTCIAFRRYDQEMVQHLASQAEVVIVQGFTLSLYPCLQTLHKIVVVDLYDPFHLENLELHTRRAPERAHELTAGDLDVINDQLRLGDFFICASERQRDFWLGALGSLGRLSPELYQTDPTFRALIDVVPFGIQPEPPTRRQAVLKGVVPGIGAHDRVVLWGGGIWDWLDPLTVIRAMALIARQRDDVKLFFLGAQHPNTADVPRMAMYDRAVALAEELGLLNRVVFFNDRWVPYGERASYLLEADVGVSAHLEHIETRFAFRTRLLDYIWSALPMVVSAGDALADVVVTEGLGRVVPIGDAEAYAQAVLDLLAHDDPRAAYHAAFSAVQQRYTWPQVLQPLIRFCQQPRYAPDKRRHAARRSTAESEARLPSAQRRIDELDAIVAQKNEHIAYLERLIHQLESGRVMRLLRWIDRRGRRG